MSEYKPTPFEIAIVAAIIQPKVANLNESHLEKAFHLLRASADYLERPTKSDMLRHEQWLKQLGVKMYSLNEVLKQTPPATGDKKGRTKVGTIATRPGLLKALRRVFPPQMAEDIIESGYLLEDQINAIVADQNKRNIAKTEAASRSKKKTVK